MHYPAGIKLPLITLKGIKHRTSFTYLTGFLPVFWPAQSGLITRAYSCLSKSQVAILQHAEDTIAGHVSCSLLLVCPLSGGSLSSSSVHGKWKLWSPEDLQMCAVHPHTLLMPWQLKSCWELLDLRPLKEGPHCSELPCVVLGMCNATPTWGLVSDPCLVP